MKKFYKNPVFYYVLVPILACLWPLMVWGVSLPNSIQNYKDDKQIYEESMAKMNDILTLDPDRLKSSENQKGGVKFEFTTAINEVATNLGIKYSLSSKPARRKVQTAHVSIDGVKIVKVAEFITKLQVRWADLQCQQIVLSKNKDLPDAWKVELDLKYYY